MLKSLCQGRKEIEILNSLRTSSDRQNLHHYMERRNAAQNRLSEAEADMEIRRWEQKSSETALYETHQEPESQRLQLHQANHWADQAQREKINLCGELEMRNRIDQESHTRTCQEIEEFRRICCEETDRARQARIDELIVFASKEESYNCESVSVLNSGFGEQSKILVRCERILRSSGATHVPA